MRPLRTVLEFTRSALLSMSENTIDRRTMKWIDLLVQSRQKKMFLKTESSVDRFRRPRKNGPAYERTFTWRWLLSRVHNRSRGVIAELSKLGAVPANSARDLARDADVILTALPTPESVITVYEDFATEARQGQVFMGKKLARASSCLYSTLKTLIKVVERPS